MRCAAFEFLSFLAFCWHDEAYVQKYYCKTVNEIPRVTDPTFYNNRMHGFRFLSVPNLLQVYNITLISLQIREITGKFEDTDLFHLTVPYSVPVHFPFANNARKAPLRP